MISSLLSKDITVTKYPPVIRKNSFKSNSPLPVVDDRYSFTMVRNTLDSLITTIEILEPPLYWYDLSDNSKCGLYEFFRLEYCVCLSILKICGLIRQKKVNGKTSISVEKDKWIIFLSQYELINVESIISKKIIVVYNKPTRKRKSMIFIRIGTKSSSSYTKATT